MRNPVTISSKISTMPCRFVTSRNAARNPGSGSSTRCSGSTMTAASSAAWRSISAIACAASLKGATSTVPPVSGGTPTESGSEPGYGDAVAGTVPHRP